MRTLHYQGLIQQGSVNILYDTTDHFYGVNYLLQQEIIQRLHLLRIVYRVPTVLENPGKSLNLKNKIPDLESP